MVTIRRDVASTPLRSPSETWDVVADLVGAAGPSVRSELDMVSNVALQLIAQEATRQDPIVVTGLGPRIVVYTVHGDLAVEPDSDDLGRIPGLIDSSDWEASLPASAEDEPWARVALARKSARVTVRATE